MIAEIPAREATVSLIEKILDAWNSHDPDRAAELYSPEFEGIDVGESEPQRGRDGVRDSLRRYVSAFPDLHFTRNALLFENDRVVLHWTASGTHAGPLMRIPPTGRKVEVQGISLLDVEGNQVRRGVYIWDVAGLLRSIGLLPEL